MSVRAYAALRPGAPLEPFTFEEGELGPEQVEIAVESCGVCHSDLSMVDNAWGQARYPLVPGHEAIGKIIRIGPAAKGLRVGQRVGLGWFSGSCTYCPQCLAGDHNLCVRAEQTLVGRHGGFAERVRCHWTWAIPLPDGVDAARAGPLFCGGITVFNPIIQCGVRPMDRVGVVGIGGLGHLALQFLNKWGCEVTAFSSNPAKQEEARRLGAHQVVSSTEARALNKIAGTLDFILVTVNVSLDWGAYLRVLRPRGRLHVVGAVLAPISLGAFDLIGAQKSVSGSPLGSPGNVARMLEFCARHDIAPMTESFPFSRVNQAFARLRAGQARYRIVLENDWS